MTFPQPDSVQAVLTGLQAWRLLTPLVSAGDLYESEVGALAFALGPNSDLSNIRVSYPDAQAPEGLQNIFLTPDRPYVGRISAQVGSAYIRSNTRRGRILISPEDIYDPEWRPPDFDSDSWQIIPPQLDVLQYFINPPSLLSQRSDRTFRFQYLNVAGTENSYLAIPAYGRKSGFFHCKNNTGGAINLSINAVRFSTSDPAGTQPGLMSQYEAGIFTAAVADEASAQFPFKASTDGMWDYLIILLASYTGGPFSIDFTLSDDAL